uniref:ATP synthase F0 subunit b n=1 Tax=Gefionella okellyi TaxID=2853422 RepID=A0A0B5H814_9EUKA|nr:ATP synthase F0 subunit b [Gefionella okellyi]
MFFKSWLLFSLIIISISKEYLIMNEEILILIVFMLFIYMTYYKLESMAINDNVLLITTFNTIRKNEIAFINKIRKEYVKYISLYKSLSFMNVYYDHFIIITRYYVEQFTQNIIKNITNTQLLNYNTLFNNKKHLLFLNIVEILTTKINVKYNNTEQNKNLKLLTYISNANKLKKLKK